MLSCFPLLSWSTDCSAVNFLGAPMFAIDFKRERTISLGADSHPDGDLGHDDAGQFCAWTTTVVCARRDWRTICDSAASDAKSARGAEHGLRELPYLYLVEADPQYPRVRSR